MWTLAHPEATDCQVAGNGTSCDDADPCTTGETCQAGTCSVATATTITCDAALACGCPSQKRAVLIAGATGPLSADDASLKARLETLGYGVWPVRDRDAQAMHLANKNLVVIAESTLSANLSPALASVAVPFIVAEPGYFRTLGMTDASFDTHWGAADAAAIHITDSQHPLSAGLSGQVALRATSGKMVWGQPAPTALHIASLPDQPSRAAIFAYHAGASMVVGVAPARRVGFFAGAGVPADMNENAWALFDAAVTWAASTAPSALLVTGAQSPAGDSALRSRIATLGYDVQEVAAATLVPAHAKPHRIGVVSETVASGHVNTKLRDAALPLMVMEPAIYDDMGMTGPAWNIDQGAVELVAGQRELTVSGTGHPLAAGLSGTVTVSSTAAKFVWGVPGSAALPIAHIPQTPQHAAIFAYRAKVQMAVGIAPARRLGFFAGDTAPLSLNDNGWKLFDASIRWLAMPEKEAAFVVADAQNLNASDAALKARLIALDYEVRVHSGPNVVAADVASAQVVVISESVLSSTVSTRLSAISVPLVSLEPALFDELGMTGGTWQQDQGDAQNQTTLVVSDSAQPLAAGLSGTTTITTAPAKFVWGAPSSAALRVAHVAGQPNQTLIFGYQAGAQMVVGAAPARRVGWFAGDNTAGSFNDSGWLLFDAAIRWATSAPGACEGASDGTTCEDGNACTVADRCVSGRCEAGDPRVCDDANACTQNTCSPVAGCLVNRDALEGATCDDGSACTTNDVCQAGACKGTPGASVCALVPHVACVEPVSGGLRAHLGYINPANETIAVAPGSQGNKLSSTPLDGALPASFPPGISEVAFTVAFPGSSLSWTLGEATVVASAASPACCAGVPPTAHSSPVENAVFRDGWEDCHPSGSWRDRSGNESSFAQDDGMTAPLAGWAACTGTSGRVQSFKQPTASSVRSSWFNLIPITTGQTYCLSAWINWMGGPRPFVNLHRFDALMSPKGGIHPMMGAAGSDGLNGQTTTISADSGFRRYHKTFTAPADTAFIQIEHGTSTSASKPGAPLTYFDDVLLVEGACALLRVVSVGTFVRSNR